MSDTNDTIDGLLAEFRGYSAGMPDSYHVTMSWHDFRVMLDRLEAAHRRELAADGDAAKLREALDYCRDMVADLIHHIGHDEDYLEREMKELVAKCNTALSAPPRNCEVGTAEEQDARFESFCDAHRCLSCPAKTPRPFLSTCALKWAQMPYEADAQKGGAE